MNGEKIDLDRIYIASGMAHPELAVDIAEAMGAGTGPVDAKIFPDGEIYSRYTENVRGKDVFIVQSHIGTDKMTVNDAFMQQCLLADAARSSSAREITAVIPNLAYSRQDRKSKGREAIGTRAVINMLTAVGVNRIVTVDMHSAQSQAIFQGPFDHLTMQRKLRYAMQDEIAEYSPEQCVVVAPDAGASKSAEKHRANLGVGLVHMAKNREPGDSLRVHHDEFVPGVDGKVCMVFDDMIDTAGTIASASKALKSSGALAIHIAATHAIFSDPAIERLQDAPIDRILVTDTVPTQRAEKELEGKIRIVPSGPMIGHALTQIFTHGSVSELFDDQNHM